MHFLSFGNELLGGSAPFTAMCAFTIPHFGVVPFAGYLPAPFADEGHPFLFLLRLFCWETHFFRDYFAHLVLSLIGTELG